MKELVIAKKLCLKWNDIKQGSIMQRKRVKAINERTSHTKKIFLKNIKSLKTATF